MQVVRDRDEVGRARVLLLDGEGEPVAPVCRFLAHLADADYSPHTAAAYGYDLRLLFEFCGEQGLDWREFRPTTALAFLGFLRRRPSRRPAQRLGLAVVAPGGRLLAPATVARALAATSSFYDWAISAEEFTDAENPLQRRPDLALARTSDRHRPATGRASRQAPIRRTVRVRLPQRRCLWVNACGVKSMAQDKSHRIYAFERWHTQEVRRLQPGTGLHREV